MTQRDLQVVSPTLATVSVTQPVHTTSQTWMSVGTISIENPGVVHLMVNAVIKGHGKIAVFSSGVPLHVQHVYGRFQGLNSVSFQETLTVNGDIELKIRADGPELFTLESADIHFADLSKGIEVATPFTDDAEMTMSIGSTEPNIVSILEEHLNDRLVVEAVIDGGSKL